MKQMAIILCSDNGGVWGFQKKIEVDGDNYLVYTSSLRDINALKSELLRQKRELEKPLADLEMVDIRAYNNQKKEVKKLSSIVEKLSKTNLFSRISTKEESWKNALSKNEISTSYKDVIIVHL